MSKFEIRHLSTGLVIYKDEADSFSALVQAAVHARADLSSANLIGASLSRTNLSRANLYGADMTYANLSGTNLSGANLSYADLSRANLSDANLYGVNLRGAILSGAILSGANLTDVNNADLIFAQLSIVPEHGPFFAWKKCRDNVLVRLFIPSKAKRSSATGRKCRAERAKVLEVIGAEVGVSRYDSGVTYKVGQWVRADKWDDNRWNECSSGIHFFLTRVEAENYE